MEGERHHQPHDPISLSTHGLPEVRGEGVCEIVGRGSVGGGRMVRYDALIEMLDWAHRSSLVLGSRYAGDLLFSYFLPFSIYLGA